MPFLKGRRRTELEQVLSVFDQSNLDKDFHILNVKEEDLPKKYSPIVKRLIMAIADAQLRNQMKVEDDIIEEFRGYIHALREKELEVQAKEKEIQNQNQEIQNQNQEILNQNTTIHKTIILLFQNGTSVAQISKAIGFSIEEIQKIIDSQ